MKLSPALTRQLAPWRARWERQAKRIDALSLRERAILFLALVAVLAAVLDSLVLTPLQNRAKLRAEALATQSSEIKALRDKFIEASRGGLANPASKLQSDLAAAEHERNRLENVLASTPALMGSGPEGDGLPAVLQRLLAQHSGLNLNRVALLDGPGARASDPLLPGMRWQGVDFQVEGPYAELTRYIQALEKQLPGLQWGELRVTGSGQESGGSARMQAQLYLLRRPS